MRKYIFLLIALFAMVRANAQIGLEENGMRQIDPDGNISRRPTHGHGADSLGSDKEIPKGIYVWTIDRRFGDRTPALPDTLSHMFMNSIYTTGLRGEYNTTGNIGTPRQNRIFIDRYEENRQFIFTNPYDFFITPPERFHFTNTLSPFTNLSYNTCGNRINGEDHFTARFGVNAGKKIGAGFKFDYIYGRGYYSNQPTSHMNYTLYGSYLGDRYQAHLLATLNNQKIGENGGITNDAYVTNPEIFNENFQKSEIPTMLSQNWNRNNNQHVLLSHRFNMGYNRKVKMTEEEIKAKRFALASQKEAQEKKAKEAAIKKARKEGKNIDEDNIDLGTTVAGRPDNATIADAPTPGDSLAANGNQAGAGRIKVGSKAQADSLLAAEAKAKADTSWLKNEYVPVTAFIHTLDFNNYKRVYQAYDTPKDFYLDQFNVRENLSPDSIYDKTTHWSLRNTFALSMLEGFNKWAKAGLKAFATHELRHFAMPDTAAMRSWNENAVSVGGQLSKAQGRTLHYNVVGEFGLIGANAGEIRVDGNIDLNFPLFKDTMTLVASGFYHHERPGFYYRHYQSRHYWWDNDDMPFTDHLRVQGLLNYRKTRTTLRVAYDIIHNHTYFANTYKEVENARLFNTISVKQHTGALSLITAQLTQDLTFGPVNWESVVTLQKSTNDDVLPLPLINAYTNLYLRFKIAKVLKCDLGADLRYFTAYNAPNYVPAIGQFAVQDNENKVKIGNYPVVNVYANFHLKQTRFFVMMSHVNAGAGKRNYFFTPHYPLNTAILRLGLSWNFYN